MSGSTVQRQQTEPRFRIQDSRRFDVQGPARTKSRPWLPGPFEHSWAIVQGESSSAVESQCWRVLGYGACCRSLGGGWAKNIRATAAMSSADRECSVPSGGGGSGSSSRGRRFQLYRHLFLAPFALFASETAHLEQYSICETASLSFRIIGSTMWHRPPLSSTR